jgi:hypothetical protein
VEDVAPPVLDAAGSCAAIVATVMLKRQINTLERRMEREILLMVELR